MPAARRREAALRGGLRPPRLTAGQRRGQVGRPDQSSEVGGAGNPLPNLTRIERVDDSPKFAMLATIKLEDQSRHLCQFRFVIFARQSIVQLEFAFD